MLYTLQAGLGKVELSMAYFHDAHYSLPLVLVGVDSSWIVSTSMKYEDRTFRCILNKHSMMQYYYAIIGGNSYESGRLF